MGRNVCLDCVALHFNSLWLQCDMLKPLSMENPNFPEKLKTTATPVNQNYLLLRLITFVLLGKHGCRKSAALRFSWKEPCIDISHIFADDSPVYSTGTGEKKNPQKPEMTYCAIKKLHNGHKCPLITKFILKGFTLARFIFKGKEWMS